MKNRLAPFLAGCAILLTGCSAYEVRDPYYPYGQPVVVAPPPARYESPGLPPSIDHVWITGYWGWGGAGYTWMPGYWEAPRPGYYWAPHRWEHDGQHWRQHGGRWEAETRRQPTPHPLPHVEERATQNTSPPLILRRNSATEDTHPRDMPFVGPSKPGAAPQPRVEQRLPPPAPEIERQRALTLPDRTSERDPRRRAPDEKSRDKHRDNDPAR